MLRVIVCLNLYNHHFGGKMFKRRRSQVILPPMRGVDRLQFVRIEGTRTYYIDKDNPTKGEFYIDDLSIPRSIVRTDAELLRPLIKEVHPRFPKFGPYFFDKKEGRDVFLGDGQPFYVGLFEGKEHKIFLGPRFNECVFTSKANAPSTARMHGVGSLGGVGKNT